MKVPKVHEDWHWHSPFFHVLIVWVVRWGGDEVPAVSKALMHRLQPRQRVDAITWCADRALKLHTFYCVELNKSNFGGHCPLGCLYQWEFCHFSRPSEQDPNCSKILTPKIKGKKSTQVFICVLVLDASWPKACTRTHAHTYTQWKPSILISQFKVYLWSPGWPPFNFLMPCLLLSRLVNTDREMEAHTHNTHIHSPVLFRQQKLVLGGSSRTVRVELNTPAAIIW